jgi:hypothetical protein
MNNFRLFCFWVLAPALYVLLVAPIVISHVTAHFLIDRMRVPAR